MKSCTIHKEHSHKHGLNCGHTAIEHDGHVDYLHGGHLHHLHDGHVDEHVLSVSETNPDACTPKHTCTGHKKDHVHGINCGHQQVPHGDHMDFLVEDHLHHPHGDHCDNHGKVAILNE